MYSGTWTFIPQTPGCHKLDDENVNYHRHENLTFYTLTDITLLCNIRGTHCRKKITVLGIVMPCSLADI